MFGWLSLRLEKRTRWLLAREYRPARWALVVGVLVLMAFGIAIRGEFCFDDGPVIVQNRYLEHPGDWPRLFREPMGGGSGRNMPIYRPLPLWSLAIDRAVWGLNPAPYHVGNLLLHLLNALLVYLLARRLEVPPWVGAFASALFAVHPIQTEAVAYITGRFDLMACTGMLGAILLYASGRDVLAVLAFSGALLSKEHAIATPLILLCLPAQRPVWRRLAAYPLVIVLFLAVRSHVLGGAWSLAEFSALDNPLAHVSPGWRILSALWVAVLYVFHLAFPWNLSPDYSFRQVIPIGQLGDGRLLGVALLLLGLALLVWQVRRAPVPRWLGLAALGPFLVVSNIPMPIGTVMADRLLYLSMPALALIAASVTVRWTGLLSGRAFIAAAIMLMTVLSARQSSFWLDELRLWRHAARVSPLSAKANANYGNELLRRGRIGEAEAPLKRAIEILPSFAEPHAALARCLQELGRISEAAMDLGLVQADLAYIVGQDHLMAGREGAAAAAWQLALRLDPAHANALLSMGNLAYLRGQYDKALDLWLRAADGSAPMPELWFNIGMVYERMGARQEALSAYRRFIPLGGSTPPIRERAQQRIKALQQP
jgi:Flp pilus assembly protein TadD